MVDRTRQQFRKHAARIAPPKRRRRRRRSILGWMVHGIASFRFPWMLFNVFFLMLTALKVALLLEIGDARYVARLASYDKSDVRAQIGVALMQPDRLTLKLRDALRPFLRGGANGGAWHAKGAAILQLRPP